jgi:hypothetical protein
MALINCPECNQEVSSLASECPKCAYPIAGGGSTQASGGKIQTVEQTGKKYKLQKLISAFLIFTGLVLFLGFFDSLFIDSNAEVNALINSTSYAPVIDPNGLGFFMLVVGVSWFCLTAFLSWWHHA